MSGSGIIPPTIVTAQALPLPTPNARQWKRQISLIVYGTLAENPTVTGDPGLTKANTPGFVQQSPKIGDPVPAIDLSELSIEFRVSHGIVSTPTSLWCRIYNLAPGTALKIANSRSEFRRVTLQVGYAGNFATIFDGQIAQARRGRSSQTDTFLDIIAGEGDQEYNWGVVSQTLAAGYTDADVHKAIGQGFADATPAGLADVKTVPPIGSALSTQPYPRGRTMYGMARDYADTLADKNGMTWKIQKNQLRFIENSSYLKDQIIIVNRQTGMIGMPEQTADGVRVRMLLNPSIIAGIRLKLDNNSIQGLERTTSIKDQTFFDTTVSIDSPDGIYKVWYVDHEGATRGNDWYSTCVCLAVDQTTGDIAGVQPLATVKAVPGPGF